MAKEPARRWNQPSNPGTLAPAQHRRTAVATVTHEKTPPGRAKVDARAAMEALNVEAGPLNIWMRTQANAPAQRPWFRDTGIEAAGQLAAGRVGKAQLKAAPHRWRWKEIRSEEHTSELQS